jgi:hypothetical protein
VSEALWMSRATSSTVWPRQSVKGRRGRRIAVETYPTLDCPNFPSRGAGAAAAPPTVGATAGCSG